MVQNTFYAAMYPLLSYWEFLLLMWYLVFLGNKQDKEKRKNSLESYLNLTFFAFLS